MTIWLTIGISGVTCGGKSTLAQSLCRYFSNPENAFALNSDLKIELVKLINQDEYFLPIESEQHTWIEKLNHINWDILSAFDIDKMKEDINNILGIEYLNINSIKYIRSKYSQNDFTKQSNVIGSPYPLFKRHPVKLPISINILIIEGILVFNDLYTLDLCDVKFHMHLPYEKCYDRRRHRVYVPPDVIGYFEMCVWPYYEKSFKEIKDREDIIKLNGEISRENIFNYVLKIIKNVVHSVH